MKWQTRFLRNAIFGLLPYPGLVRRLKRKLRPYPAPLSQWQVDEAIKQVQMLKSTGKSLAGATVVEIGTGWQPVIPLIFYLCGCSRVITVDMQRLLDRDLVVNTATAMLGYREALANGLTISVDTVTERLAVKRKSSIDETLAQFGIEYRAPEDINETELAAGSVDVITSHEVLEHVPPATVLEIFTTCRRLLADDGKMCHFIDNSDHWEHEDKSLTTVNFLKYSDRTFDLLCKFNPLDYQNRLRHFQYLEMLDATGFKVDLDTSYSAPLALRELATIELSEKYRQIPEDALAVLMSYVVASKAG